MFAVFRTLLIGQFRDAHTLFWTILLPFALLIGLGLYFDEPVYAERLLAGVVAVNILFGPGMVTPFQVMTLRNRGVFKLLRAASLPTSAFIAASALARTALSLVVGACLVAASAVGFGVKPTIPGLALMLFALLLGSVCFTAVGFITGNLARNESDTSMISNLVCLPMLFASEAFYSLEHAPQWVKIASLLHPFSHFVDLLSAAVHGSRQADTWTSAAALAGFTAVCLAVAAATFRWDQEGVRFRFLVKD
ncbi:ABC-2 type transporter [Thermobacillus xylanilyticus]|uniref:Transport permease protein n=1 Tax=Thermobacillus xylanilyticus TaxID=76633 RepID=A0ABM8V479_THEXY|nr:ABC transporter permease [Thermobacillus xylanilyticus]CAG5086343.1 ABC-2 type transporter [Thermobacillus xylanilyticus]